MTTRSQGTWKHDEVVLVLIDYQEEMFANIGSETPAELVELNTRFLVRTAKAFDIPVILSTVGVEMGVNGPTRTSIADEIPDAQVVDRSSMDAWEDKGFRAAIEKTGRKRLVFCALYTEICLAYPTVEALKDGYEVMFIVDAVGGVTQLAHRTAIERLTAAGAIPSTSLAATCEWFRDWKSPLADKGRDIFAWYMPEAAELEARKKKA